MITLAIIPARGGSKRIARKNIRTFFGAPMLSHPLRAAAASGIFDEIHVSTNDPEIASVARAEGFAPRFAREDALSDDMTPIRTVVHNAMLAHNAEGIQVDTVALIYATAALLEPNDIITAHSAFLDDPSRPLLSVVETGTPVEKMLCIKDGVLRPAIKGAFNRRTQDLLTTYRDAGVFCFFSAKTLNEAANCDRWLEFRPYLLEPWKGLDIDTELDWRFSEIVKAGLDNSNLKRTT